MIQVSISNSANNGSWGGQFPDQQTANAWIAQGEAAGWWGAPAQAAIPAVAAVAASYSGTPAGATTAIVITANTAGIAGNISLTLDGKSQLSAIISTWNTANPSNQLTLTSGDGTQIPSAGSVALINGVNAVAAVPAVPGYTITQTDITAQVALQAAIQKGLQCQNLGASIVAQVYAYNEANLASGALTSAQFTAMLADSTISNIERLLWNGSLNTALALVNSYNATLLTYFSSAQIAALVAAINNSGLL